MKPNYKESKQILEEVKKAKRILINCHRGPDPDAIGSALAMYRVLIKMDKQVKIICPSAALYNNLNFLKDYKKIKSGVDFSTFDFSKYDLFIALDSSNWDQVSGSKTNHLPDMPILVIDHHTTNTYYGEVNFVDKKATSVGEMVFWMFNDWKMAIDKETATCLMAAIIGDTGAFRYPGSSARTFEAAQYLMERGADKDEIIHHIYRSEPFSLIKFWGEVLSTMKLDEKGKFVWSAIPYKVYKGLGKPASAKETSASLFTQNVAGSEFGFVAVELEEGKLAVSIRSRTGFDVSRIALELGGGGHRYAAGGGVKGLPFDKAVEKVLKVARKYARKSK